MHYIPRNVSVRPHQVSHRVTNFDILLRNNNLYRVLQRCASSSNFVIRSLQMSDAFHKSSFFLNYLTLMDDGDRLIQLLMCWTSIRVSSILFLHNNEKLRCSALKIRILNWRLQNLGNLFRCRFHDKCVVKHLEFWLKQLHVSVRQCAVWTPTRLIFSFLLLTVSCLPQSFDVRMPSLLSHYSIPVLWLVYDATVGVMLKFFFSPIRVIMCKHLFCNEFWLTIFCAHALFTVPTIWTMCLQ